MTSPARMAALAAANAARTASAAQAQVAAAQAALARLGPAAPPVLADAGWLRVGRPSDSLAELAGAAGVTKHAYAGRLRRLIALGAAPAPPGPGAAGDRPRPSEAFWAVSAHDWQAGWTHPDPGGVCAVRGKVHRKHGAAVGCERNSQLIAWKRRRAQEAAGG